LGVAPVYRASKVPIPSPEFDAQLAVAPAKQTAVFRCCTHQAQTACSFIQCSVTHRNSNLISPRLPEISQAFASSLSFIGIKQLGKLLFQYINLWSVINHDVGIVGIFQRVILVILLSTGKSRLELSAPIAENIMARRPEASMAALLALTGRTCGRLIRSSECRGFFSISPPV
jgi:hypothetical protein